MDFGPLPDVPAVLAVALAVGLLGAELVSRLGLPWISGAILAGIVIGPSALGVMSVEQARRVTDFSHLSLGVIAFDIGSGFVLTRVRKLGGGLVAVALAQLVAPAVLVFAALTALGLSLPMSLILGGIAMATAPTTTLVILKARGASGPFADAALGVLTINDTLTVLVVAVLAAIARDLWSASADAGIWPSLLAAAKGEGAAIGVGLAIGALFLLLRALLRPDLPGASGRLTALVLTGLVAALAVAETTGLSPLLIPLAFGLLVGNLLPEPDRLAVRALIQPFSDPLFILFFVLAGVIMPISALGDTSLLAAAAAYVAARFLGKWSGVAVSTSLLGWPGTLRRWLGLAFASQGALAMGLILALASQPAAKALPPTGATELQTCVHILLVAVLLSQLFGPYLIDLAVRRGSAATAPPSAGPG